MTQNKLGIIDSIKTAETASEVDKLLKKLEGYKYASKKTVRKAKKAAHQRKKDLE